MTLIAYGNNVVFNILNSSFFSFIKVLIKENRNNNEKLFKLLKNKKILYQILNENQFSKYNFDKQNQGIVAFLKDYSYISFDELIKLPFKQKFPFIVILDNIMDPHNFGAILRSSAALNIDGIIISKKNQVPINSTVIKVSAGGIAYVPVCQVNNLFLIVKKLKNLNYQIVTTTCSSYAISYQKYIWNKPICLIFGNEHQGIRDNILKIADCSIYIPVSNNMNSFNVAVSYGIICSKIIYS